MVSLDIRGDCRVEHICAWIAGLKTLAQVSCGDIFMDGLQQMNASSLVWRQTHVREVCQRKPWAAYHNPLRKLQQAIRLVPAPKIEEAVRANQIEEARIGHRLM